MRSSIRQQLKQSRAFFFALVAVAIVWIVTAMSEQKQFRESYPIAYDYLDTSLYAIQHKDSILTIDISSNGFNTFRRSKEKRNGKAIHFDMAKLVSQHANDSAFSLVINTDEYLDLIKKQLNMHGVSEVSPVNEKLTLQIALRESKAFVPEIGNVTFNFDKMVGLSGEPVIIPDSVYLYGSHESLSKVETIEAKPCIINNIGKSGRYKIPLSKSWEKYPDLRISTNEIEIYLPVEKFIEQNVTLPIVLTDKNDNEQWNLYPPSVTVQLLVPESKIGSIDLSKCVVSASTKECIDNHIVPQLTKFPSSVRLKSIIPEKVQYIIIEE